MNPLMSCRHMSFSFFCSNHLPHQFELTHKLLTLGFIYIMQLIDLINLLWFYIAVLCTKNIITHAPRKHWNTDLWQASQRQKGKGEDLKMWNIFQCKFVQSSYTCTSLWIGFKWMGNAYALFFSCTFATPG